MPRASLNMLALQRVHREARGVYRTRLSHSFDIMGVPNGGYLSFVAGEAMSKTAAEATKGASSEHSQPISLHANFVSKAQGNAEALVEVETLQTSRTTTTLLARLSQDGALRACFTGIFGDHSAFTGPTRVDAAAPDLPRPDVCESAMPRLAPTMESFRIAKELELLVPPKSAFAQHCLAGVAEGEPVLEGWGGFSQPHSISLPHLLFFGDAFPPPIFNHTGRSTWLPTLEYGVHLRRAPPTDATRVRVRFRSRFLMDGLMEEDGEIWSEEGQHLLAQTRQLARVLVPREAGATVDDAARAAADVEVHRAELRRQLAEAVANEDFEEAARLKKLESALQLPAR